MAILTRHRERQREGATLQSSIRLDQEQPATSNIAPRRLMESLSLSVTAAAVWPKYVITSSIRQLDNIKQIVGIGSAVVINASYTNLILRATIDDDNLRHFDEFTF